ncbi:hypothetical protein QZH41_011815, partial [Actinostola sp. cb2023]
MIALAGLSLSSVSLIVIVELYCNILTLIVLSVFTRIYFFCYLDPPQITYPHGPHCEPISPIENETISLLCNVTGFPKPNITWTNNDKSSNGSPVLVLENILRNQTGIYTCSADNGIGTNCSACWIVTVKYPPQITYPHGPHCEPISPIENETISLLCNVTGFPKPNITWTNNDKLSSKGSQLVLENILRNQTGIYTCSADNGIGMTPSACWNITSIK